ncbi:MAG: hypothetical protein Q9207_002187 [Kuettlingeria erythrocarpa]
MVFAEHYTNLRQTHPSQCNQSRTALLLVSRAITAEVQPQYNRESWFDTSGREDSAVNFDPDRDIVDSPLPQLPYPHVVKVPGPPFQRVFSEDTRARLEEDVSKIFTRYNRDLPEWLFGGPYLCSARNDWKARRSWVAGWGFARFLRQFGSVNAGEIESLRICSAPGEIFHLRHACWGLPLYASIIRQHLPNIKRIILGGLKPSAG